MSRAIDDGWPVALEQRTREALDGIVGASGALMEETLANAERVAVAGRIREAALEVREALDGLRARFDEEARRASVDGLTGQLNRAAFDEQGPDMLARARAEGAPVCLIAFDVDHFKRINDSHGHPVGDEVLRAVAARCRRALRPANLFARVGGEEFAAVVAGASIHTAARVAERLRRAVCDHPVSTRVGPIGVAISLGVAEDDGGSWALLSANADTALYDAKSCGRNQVRLAVTARVEEADTPDDPTEG